MDEKNGEKRYQVELPYPPVQVRCPNLRYARAMLDNVGGRNSEMSAVSLYFYNHVMTSREEEVSTAFHRMSLVEMHHLEIFAELARQLGEDPRLWTQVGVQKIYWSPGYNQYPRRLDSLLNNALTGEKDAIQKYQRQLQAISDDNIRENLQRIIQDEELHVEILMELRQRCRC